MRALRAMVGAARPVAAAAVLRGRRKTGLQSGRMIDLDHHLGTTTRPAAREPRLQNTKDRPVPA